MIMTKKIITLNEVKRNNLRSVLELLLRSDGLSRVEIAEKLGCDNTTVSRAVRELIDFGIINTGEKSGSSNGRPRVALQVNPAGPQLLGVAFKPDGISGILTNLKSEPVRTETILFHHCRSQQEYLASAAEMIGKLQRAAGSKLAGIGISVFGSYYGPDALLEKVAALPILDGLKLRPFFTGCTGRDVIICDHTVAIAAYLTRGNPELTTGDVMLINVGKGLGTVLLNNGKKLFNRNNHGGELGHTIRIPGGEKCACGRRGCLETLVSIPALVKKHQIFCKKKVSWEALSGQFCNGEPAAEEIILPAINILAEAVAEQLNNYPVGKLVISGDILKLGIRFQECFKKSVLSSLFSLAKEELAFYFPPIDSEDAFAVGASILAAEDYVTRFELLTENT